jgi:dienelactone hydrolase
MFFEPLAVLVTAAVPGEQLTIKATIGNYESSATFVASEEGTIDTREDAPSAGTYEGVDVDGLIWSALPPESGQGTFGDGIAQFSLERGGEVLTTQDVERLEIADGVEPRDVPGDAGFVGVVYVPEGPGPHPVVIGFGGSEGGLWFGDAIARTYASMGYVGVGVAYFGEPSIPSGLTDLPLEYFEAVFAHLDTIEEADPSRIAVMGASRGGELALLLGAHYPEVDAVVALVPSGYVWGSADVVNAAAWTWQGVALPRVPNSDAQPEVTEAPDGKDVYHFTPTFLDSIAEATPEELEAATTAVEATNGPVLLIGGGDDQLWPSCALSDVSMARLEASGHAAIYGDQNLCFEDSGHYTNPLNVGFPMTTASLNYDPAFDVYFAVGGTPEGLGRAARVSFETVEAFLASALSR